MTHDKPTVSVVVASRGNRPEMLKVAIDSIVGQTYSGDVECLIVFDQASPDASLERTSEGRRVRVVPNARAAGLAGARNTGIEAATGELVAFCDDDDYWRETKLERQVAELGDERTSVTGIEIDYGGHRVQRSPDPAQFTLENLIRHRLMEAHPSTVLMRRSAILDEIGLVDEDIPGSYGEDFDFIIRAASAGPVSVVPEPLVVVRWGQSMFSRDWTTMVAAIDYLVDKHEAFRRDNRAMARLHGRRAFANAAMGRRADALRDIWAGARANLREKRLYVALAALVPFVKAERLLAFAHRRGRGI